MTSMYDADDVQRMRWALDALADASKLAHDPHRAYERWQQLTVASLLYGKHTHWSVYLHIAWAARETAWEIHAFS